jgi:hypothetical protein
MFGIHKNKANDTLKELNMSTIQHSLGYQIGLLEATMPMLTLTDGISVYNALKQSINTLNKKFSIDELEGKSIPTQEEFNKFFEENIFPLIDYSKTKFFDCYGKVSKTPTSRIELRNSDNEWLFDYNYDQENQYFWYSYDRVYTIFMNTFSLQDVDRHRLMKSLAEKHFKLYNVTTGTIEYIVRYS